MLWLIDKIVYELSKEEFGLEALKNRSGEK